MSEYIEAINNISQQRDPVFFSIQDLQLITIDNPYTSIHVEEIRQLLGEIVHLRAAGYGPEYPAYYLPVDTSDFVGRHHLFCIRQDGKWRAVGGFRQLRLSICDFYKLTESHLGLAMHAKSSKHIEALLLLFDEHRQKGLDLISGTKVTIAKEYRANKELGGLIKEFIAALLLDDKIELNVKTSLGSGVPRFKTDLYLERMGFGRLEIGETSLGELQVDQAGSEPIVIMKTEQYSQWVEECHEKHFFKLKGRLWFHSNEQHRSTQKVA